MDSKENYCTEFLSVMEQLEVEQIPTEMAMGKDVTEYRRELGKIKQFTDETLEQFSNRTRMLTIAAYPGIPEEFIEIVAADAIVKGYRDEEVKKSVNHLHRALN